MERNLNQPISFQPILKEKIWGGGKLREVLGKDAPPDAPVGESWEISHREGDTSKVVSGPHEGKTLGDLMREHAVSLLGERLARRYPNRFPLLVKFIHAQDDLSVQVHPDDALAKELGETDPGKTECWYILDAEPGARLVIGFRQKIESEDLEELYSGPQVQDLLNYVEVQAGDCVFLPAGTVHAIGRGILLAEIQQNSDVTYRVYDYDRVDSSGEKRPLHVEQAICSTRPDLNLPDAIQIRRTLPTTTRLAECEYFVIEKVCVAGSFDVSMEDSFEILMGIEGGGEVCSQGGSIDWKAGQTVLVPHRAEKYQITGDGNIVRAWVP